MLQDFTQKKTDDYLKIVNFHEDNITLRSLKESGLPPFIINFFDCTIPKGKTHLSRKEFEQTLNKAIVFNINYIIKPRGTLVKFLFGEVETRPLQFIRDRLGYFQFYGYYVSHISDFLNLNTPETVSVNQVKHLIDEINSKILAEVNDPSNGDSQRLNLVKLLYYFFHDLPGNNPINIKLPKKILSVYLQDKGFTEIKSRVDNFFSDEIFIQEAIELMKPGTQKSKSKANEDLSEEKVKEIVSNAKTSLINTTYIKTNLINRESSNKDLEKTLQAQEKLPEIASLPDVSKLPDIKSIREAEVKMPGIKDKKVISDDEIYSDDLLFASQLNDLVPPVPLTDEEVKAKLIDKIFYKDSYKKNIIKKIFNKNAVLFQNTVSIILDFETWKQASGYIANYYDNSKIDYFSDEAVKFVDLLDVHFKNKAENSIENTYKRTGNV